MVSCTRVDNALQAYVDGELGDSDRAIFEQHLAECGPCRESLRRQQHANAALFAAFSNDRLGSPLRHRVLAHLPIMEAAPRDPVSVVDQINERAKNPRTMWGRVGKLMPAAAVAILLFVTLVLRYSVMETPDVGPVSTIGMVTNALGTALYAPGNGPLAQDAELQDFVMRGDRFETHQGSFLMLALTGPTTLKIGPSTRVLVSDARNISLDYGRIWLDVGRDGRLFQVHTPRGEVTVFGTCFTVSYVNDTTTVTVERGEVQVENGDAFRVLDAGQQTVVPANGSVTDPVDVNARAENSWARLIMPDPTAVSVFNQRIQVKSPAGEIPSRAVYVVDTYGGAVSSLRLYWQPRANGGAAAFCTYDLYVSGAGGEPIVHRKIEGSAFAARGASSLDVPLDTPITGKNSIEVRLVPDYKTGGDELEEVEVKADVTMNERS